MEVFTCKNVIAEIDHYPRIIRRPLCLEICLSRKSLIIRKFSNTFPNCKFVLTAKHQSLIIDQRHFRIEKSLSQKSSTSRKYSKTFLPVKLSWPQIIISLWTIQNRFLLQICLDRKLSKSRKFSQTSSPENLSKPQIIKIPDEFKDCFAWKNVFASNHQYPGNGQSLFRQEKSHGRKSSISRSYSRKFSSTKLSWLQIINIPEIFKAFFTCETV